MAARVQMRVQRVRQPRDDETLRVLVDRLWPRGVSKSAADLDDWPKELTPSTELRKAFHGGELSFEEFRKAYLAEISQTQALADLADEIGRQSGPVALLIAGDPDKQNHAEVLRDALEASLDVSSTN